VVGRLQRLELAAQQGGVHEVAGSGCQSPADQLLRPAQVDELDDLGGVVLKVVLVGVLQGGAGQDDALPAAPGLLDEPAQRLQPGPAVVVGQRDAAPNLLDVGGGGSSRRRRGRPSPARWPATCRLWPFPTRKLPSGR
jgi:hypothetical protein